MSILCCVDVETDRQSEINDINAQMTESSVTSPEQVSLESDQMRPESELKVHNCV